MPKQTPILNEKVPTVSDPMGEDANLHPGTVVKVGNLSIRLPLSPRQLPKVTVQRT